MQSIYFSLSIDSTALSTFLGLVRCLSPLWINKRRSRISKAKHRERGLAANIDDYALRFSFVIWQIRDASETKAGRSAPELAG
jgi:hypothetical protein